MPPESRRAARHRAEEGDAPEIREHQRRFAAPFVRFLGEGDGGGRQGDERGQEDAGDDRMTGGCAWCGGLPRERKGN